MGGCREEERPFKAGDVSVKLTGVGRKSMLEDGGGGRWLHQTGKAWEAPPSARLLPLDFFLSLYHGLEILKMILFLSSSFK